MSSQLKYYKNDGEESINSDEPKEVNIQTALNEIDNMPFEEDTWIGFTEEKGGTIQFIRFEQNSWFIDVPIIKNGQYDYSLQDDGLTTENVKEIVKTFFSGGNWQSLCNLVPDKLREQKYSAERET